MNAARSEKQILLHAPLARAKAFAANEGGWTAQAKLSRNI